VLCKKLLLPKLALLMTALPLFCGCASTGRPDGGACPAPGDSAFKSKGEKKAYNEGYNNGRSDGLKRFYWKLQDQQRERQDQESFRTYDVVIPEHWENGILVQPSRRTIRIQE
jgi:hypothetical protein